MLTRDTTQGTTLEILAPFLPYGIEVETGIDDGERERKQLHSLTQDGYPRCRVCGYESAELFSDMLPVLRPFAALYDSLPDGTVPACQLANLIYAGSEEPITDAEFKDVSAGFGHFNELVVTVDGAGIMCIYSDWLIDTYGNCMVPPAAYDYLRSLHFAVGLEPHQYIAKSPAPTTATIEKGTAG